MKQKSKYSASAFDEVKRLELQSKSTKKLDDKVINFVIKQGKFKGKNFAVLDVGCGYGNVAKSRFAKFENAKVLGIDINKDVIAQNNLHNQNSNFSYATFDVENENFVEDFSAYLKQNNLPKFDIIFL
ncbi:MAG: class I SAM-dependent methyltransferase, partial [Clostridia bacterium]|nr:class I SAM-dependent methyltransferase [Clostridia bacterium]